MFSDLSQTCCLDTLSPVKSSLLHKSRKSKAGRSFEVALGIERAVQTDSLELYIRHEAEMNLLKGTVRKLTQTSVKEALVEKEHQDCHPKERKLNSQLLRLCSQVEGIKAQLAEKQREKLRLVKCHRDVAEELRQHKGRSEAVVRGFKALTSVLMEGQDVQLTEAQWSMAFEAMKNVEAAGVSMQTEAHRLFHHTRVMKRRLPEVPSEAYDDTVTLGRYDSVTDIDSPIESTRTAATHYDYSYDAAARGGTLP
jgi:hypothetical protein